MVVRTRLDCVLGTAAGMRNGVEQAIHHADHRVVFGRRLVEQPLMENVLADLCVESEAATVLGLRLAGAYDRGERGFLRLATAVAKYWVCKRGPAHAAEALECLGGNGYVEESSLPRVYRQLPLLSIWEGSGNVICLDVLRAMRREPESVEAFLAELEPPYRGDAEAALADADEPGARRLVERLAVALQASLLLRHAPAAVAEAYGTTRPRGHAAYGTLPAGIDLGEIIDRHRPVHA
jgi:putative acyl-CoA dehydrogenase